jgi:ABC-type multidrug transport system fused ATPase/permease subunit
MSDTPMKQDEVEKESNKKNQEEKQSIKPNNKTRITTKKNPSVSFYKLLYHFLTTRDKWLLVLAFIGSFGVGISLPLFALFFGESLSQLNFIGSIDDFVDIFFNLLMKFIYVGISMLVGGILMYFLWTYIGRIIARRLKEQYFTLLLKQEQGFFDVENPYEFFFKLQNQVKIIENGVNFTNFNIYLKKFRWA